MTTALVLPADLRKGKLTLNAKRRGIREYFSMLR